jgi:hypothetical protein
MNKPKAASLPVVSGFKATQTLSDGSMGLLTALNSTSSCTVTATNISDGDTLSVKSNDGDFVWSGGITDASSGVSIVLCTKTHSRKEFDSEMVTVTVTNSAGPSLGVTANVTIGADF